MAAANPANGSGPGPAALAKPPGGRGVGGVSALGEIGCDSAAWSVKRKTPAQPDRRFCDHGPVPKLLLFGDRSARTETPEGPGHTRPAIS